jgi:two-component system copper resistance phosphate regulon response regulator CusR
MRILVIEDEHKVADNLKMGLEEQSYKVHLAYDGIKGKQMGLENEYDLMIIDVLLPGIGGYELCTIFRSHQISTPIMMLTALSTIEDKIKGFESGVEDYLVKPFDFRELLARIKVLLKRKDTDSLSFDILSIADLEMNLNEKSVKRSEKKIELTVKEFALLEYFMRNKNRAISRADIANKVWDISFDTGTNVIDVYVNFLRKKIDKDFSPKLIHTIKGMGYIFKIED